MHMRHLAEAEQAVADGARHLVEQERRVAKLRSDGHDVKRAEELLATFQETQAQHIAHRDLILRELDQLSLKR